MRCTEIASALGALTFVASSLAAAEPASQTSFALRAGVSAMSAPYGVTVAPNGTAPYVDAEVSARMSRTVLVSLFGAFYTIRDPETYEDPPDWVTNNARYYGIDAGLRISYYGHGAGTGLFIGLGIAFDWIGSFGRESRCTCATDLCTPCTPAPTSSKYRDWVSSPWLELHAGYTFQPIRGVAPELLALVGWIGANPDDIGPLQTTARLALGARF